MSLIDAKKQKGLEKFRNKLYTEEENKIILTIYFFFICCFMKYLIKIMEDKGCKVKYEILDDKRYGEELDRKLKEEVEEYLADYSVEEMADVMEVIYAILEYRGTSMKEVEKARVEKKNRKGAFKNRIYLKDVEED